MDSLEALQSLHQDLLVFTEANLPVLERLAAELEAQIEAFRNLLAKPPKNDESRKKLLTGNIDIDGQTYAINDDFRTASLQLADELDVDELEAARLFLLAQDDAQDLDRSPLAIAVFGFHRRRQSLLDCLRIIVRESVKGVDEDEDEALADIRIAFSDFIRRVLGYQGQDAESPSRYWQKCLQRMAEIEHWQQRLHDQMQKFTVTGQSLSTELSEVIDFQQQSLMNQHESLAAIAAYLIRGNYTIPADLLSLLSKVQKIDRYDLSLIHYASVLVTSLAHFGQHDDVCSIEDAHSINDVLVGGKESEKWTLRSFHAATVAWWLAEYSGRFNDPSSVPHLHERSNFENEANISDTQFTTALDDGAFHFMLSLAQDVNRNEWEDHAKSKFVAFLLSESALPTRDFPRPGADVCELICTGLQAFTEGFVTNMPDTIRTLRSAEDDSRRTMRSRFQRGNQDSELHIERFLLVASYAYDEDAGAARAFWIDPESNLYGFLQWASRRQTTPRVAAFCELIRSLSNNEQCADAVHLFLLDEGQPVGGRIRRTGSLSWSQILAELQFYATNPREKQAGTPNNPYAPTQVNPDTFVEPESAMMLECYLRLVSHLCKHSPTSREWLLGNPDIQFHEMLFELCTNALESRLRACAFDTVSALCTQTTPATSHKLWTSLDAWVYGTTAASSSMPKPVARLDSVTRHEELVFKSIGASLEESVAFVNLLFSLLSPVDGYNTLNDELPFPENLGAAYRMPGIDTYIDFAFGRVFGEQSLRADRQADSRSAALACLRLASLCLSAFNENLVVIANRGNVGVDGVIRTSTLSAYARLHPFARVMEWMFNEKAVLALFTNVHHDVDDINSAGPDSLLVQSLLAGIEVITSVLQLQPTYLDIIRPIVKTQHKGHRSTVGNAALASFDDAILNNLRLISDLGLYAGTGYQDLIIASLSLLQLVSISRRLNSVSDRTDRSKIIAVLERDEDADRIARGLSHEVEFDERELEAGPKAPAYAIKRGILQFLISSLIANRDRPSMAHLLLGFKCHGSYISIGEDSTFANGTSLFHTIVRLAILYPESDGGAFIHWTSTIKWLCTRTLQLLWDSPLSSNLVLDELRELDFVFLSAVQQLPVSQATVWDDVVISDPAFVISASANTYANFLKRRSSHFDLMARSLRNVISSTQTSFRQRLESTILGTTPFPGTEPASSLSLFDLFDFMELDVGPELSRPNLSLFGEVDLSICRDQDGTSPLVNLAAVQELLHLRRVELERKGQLNNTEAEQVADSEAFQLLLFIHGANQHTELVDAHRATLKAWAQLVTVTLDRCAFDADRKASFSLQVLQLILPKLERSFGEDLMVANQLGALALSLVGCIDLPAHPRQRAASGDFARDRLYQLFRVCISCIGSYEIPPDLRDLCYQICYRYLRITTVRGPVASKNILHTIKALGDRLIDTINDDAISGPGECRVSALLLLTALVIHSNVGGSKYLSQAFNKVNFVGSVVDSIKGLPVAMTNSTSAESPMLLATYLAMLSLLQQIASSATGAAVVFNAGLFQSIRDSGLFSLDPDIGFDIERRHALKDFHDLLLATLRIINATILARGSQNEQTVVQARDFLRDVRPSVVGVFKRHARVASNGDAETEDLTELVDNWTLLISLVGFLEFEDGQTSSRPALGMFS